MEKFTEWYSDGYPVAHKVENAVNSSSDIDRNIEKAEAFPSSEYKKKFIIACILYWSEAVSWDLRNKYAVLVSKRIADHFVKLGKLSLDIDIQKEAFGFTHFAHRYLQCEFFKYILRWMRTEYPEIALWVEEQEFVYAPDEKSVIPYKEYQQKYRYI